MSDDDEARIGKLTELARRVWPRDREIAVCQDGAEAEVLGHDCDSLIRIEHPRALDALEAALLVLAGEPADFDELLARSSVGQGLRALREDPEAELARVEEELTPEVMEILRRANDEPPAWVEQLAAKWEAAADAHSPLGAPPYPVDRMRRDCARELRERAKGEPCE